MRTALIIISLPAFIIIPIILLWMGFVFTSGGYNPLKPYIVTQFAPNFSPEKIKDITIGERKDKVIIKLGDPIKSYKDTPSEELTTLEYSSKVNDYFAPSFAWLKSEVVINSNEKVIDIKSFWVYW